MLVGDQPRAAGARRWTSLQRRVASFFGTALLVTLAIELITNVWAPSS